MMRLHKIYCTVFGIGYISRGGGTVAAIFMTVCWYLMGASFHASYSMQLLFTLLITAVGVWSAGRVETIWGKDSSKVVIDEVAGMGISLMFLPFTWKVVLVAFILFRYFDIVKPLFIRRSERLPGGWGVMADDVLSGIYANLILQALVFYNIF